MSYGYQMDRSYVPVEAASGSERASFIRRTYTHVALAILALVGIETVLFNIPGLIQTLVPMMMGYAWLFVIGLFMLVGYIADRWAHSDTSIGLQYAGLAIYTVAVSIILLPLLAIAWTIEPSLIPTAGILTLSIFAGLTVGVFVTKKDFSFLRPILGVASMAALGFIIIAIFFPFGKPIYLVFAFIMVALISGSILYQTSAIMRHYRTHQHVAAALSLFASIAILFYYILYILVLSRD